MWDQFVATLLAEFSDIPDAAQVTRIVLRLALAALLGGALGYERESHLFAGAAPRPGQG